MRLPTQFEKNCVYGRTCIYKRKSLTRVAASERADAFFNTLSNRVMVIAPNPKL